EGEYGICEECGCDINVKRLEARPVTTLCIDCKTLQEKKEKSQGQ
ncbi:MAG: RNA polymerase-binding protein DksA, partial [Desulfobulbaceae bacterium]